MSHEDEAARAERSRATRSSSEIEADLRLLSDDCAGREVASYLREAADSLKAERERREAALDHLHQCVYFPDRPEVNLHLRRARLLLIDHPDTGASDG